MKNKKIQILTAEQKKEFAELLKNGKAECRDFSDDILSEIVNTNDFDIREFPGKVKAELMFRDLVPADFSILDASHQLGLLLCDRCYDVNDELTASQLKWKEFSANDLVHLLKYRPGLYRHYPEWDWSMTASADKDAWYEVLERHHYYIQYCPDKVFSSFTDDEKFDIAISNPAAVTKLDLNTLPQEERDILLRVSPELVGHFKFDADNPPVKLILDGRVESCRQKTAEMVADFLIEILPEMNRKKAFEMVLVGEGLLGIFPETRGKVLEFQINDFLKKQKISSLRLCAKLKPVSELPLAAVDNLEARIIEGFAGKVVQGCLEEERLSRVDVLLTPEFSMMRRDVRSLVLMMGLPVELREEALASLIANGAKQSVINQTREAFGFDKTVIERSPMEKVLVYAALDGKSSITDDFVSEIGIEYLSVQEALDISRKLGEKSRQRFFDLGIGDTLRAYLLSELDKEYSEARENLINVLLQPYWRPYSEKCADLYDLFVE